MQGAELGTLAGAAAGAAIDHDKRGRGALIGGRSAVSPAPASGTTSRSSSRRSTRSPTPNVQQQGDALIGGVPGDVLFDTGSSSLAPGAFGVSTSSATTLNRYPDTDVIMKGHTDASGSETSNQTLSEQRSDSVAAT